MNVTVILQEIDFLREITGGCKIENVTGVSREFDFQRTLTGNRFHQSIHRVS